MRIAKIAALMLLMAFLSGCSESQQIESIAFAVVLGADLSDGGIELTLQVPKLSSAGGGEGEGQGGGGESNYLIASAKGASFNEALTALEASLPRTLSLSQLKMVVVSESLARDEAFRALIESIIKMREFYTASYFAVCRGSAREFVNQSETVIGMRISLGIIAMFEHHLKQGHITGTSLADFYYDSASVYSDPVAILCETMGGEGAPGAQEQDGITADALASETENKNKYIGAALFRDGLMVAALDGRETCLLNALSGAKISFFYTARGQSVKLRTPGNVRIDLGEAGGGLRVGVRLDMEAEAMLDDPDPRTVSEALEEDIVRLVKKCQALEIEPFDFAKHAAGRFATLNAWQAYDWNARFCEAELDIEVNITMSEA